MENPQTEARARFAALVAREDIPLDEAALAIAAEEYPDLDVPASQARLDALAGRVAARVGEARPPLRVLSAMKAVLGEEERFRGNEKDYYDPRNSFLNEVLERRLGIPITLSVLTLEVARRVGLRLQGVAFPGHFLVRCRATGAHQGQPRELLVDPFHGGAVLGEADCRRLLRRHMGEEATFDRRLLATADKRAILVRMLVNLKRVYVAMRSFPQARDIVRLLVALEPHNASELRDRGLLSYHVGDHMAALRDLEAYLQMVSRAGAAPDEDDEEGRRENQQVWEHVKTLRRRIASFN
jgi:regulator of sirC expression with transglutaminase-like and TPR domain